jgi:hypothetical protein
MFNATFSNISAISWRPVLVVEETGDHVSPHIIKQNKTKINVVGRLVPGLGPPKHMAGLNWFT